MKVTLRDIRDGSEALSKVLGTPKNATGSYRLSKLTAKLLSEDKHIEKTRIQLVKKHGEEEKDPKGEGIGRFRVTPKTEDAFNKEWEAFLDGEINLENLYPIPFKMLLGISLSAIDMARIATFVEEPTDEELEDYEKQEAEAEEKKDKEADSKKGPAQPRR